MKVKELIEILQGFDQEKNIWITHDEIYEYEPNFEVAILEQGPIKEGDYVACA